MAARGYDGASVVEIARAARLAPGLIHYHFASKGEILLALVDFLRGVVRGRYERRVAGRALGPRPRLEAYIDAQVGLGEDADPAAMACWVNVASEALRKPEVRAVFAEAVDEERAQLQGLLREVLAEEGRSAAKVRELAAAILAAIQGAYQLGLAAPGTIPPGSAAGLINRMADGLLAAQPLQGRGR
jgi:TetR/AcrR family transcriptional repressor of bet genes